jgi:DNA-binding CsgD family transcriptional regulator
VGEQKLKDFAELFVSEIRAYLTTNERRTFTENGGPLRPPRRATLNDSQLETLRRFHRGETVDEIARARGFVRSTIYTHLLAAIESGKLPQARERFFTPAQEKEIAAAFRQVANGTLVDVSALLGGKYDIGLLRIFRAFAAHSRGQRQR